MRVSRRVALVLVVLLMSGGLVLLTRLLAAVSVAGTSYVARIEDQESNAVLAYETIAGTLFFQRTADRLTAGLKDDDTRIDALVQWTHENVRPQYASPGRVVSDNAYRIVQRGFGFCDQDAHVFASLAHYAGYDSRLLFLMWPDGTSHHTVAEVKLQDRWILVDAWIGAAIRDSSGRTMTVEDLVREPAALARYGYSAVHLDLRPEYFVDGRLFRAYPYADLGTGISSVLNKIQGATPVVPTGPAAAPSPAAEPPPNRDVVVPDESAFQEQVRLYAAARADQLDGRFLAASEQYARLGSQGLDREMAESVGFFLGLALLRAGDPVRAIDAWSQELQAHPGSEWQPSTLGYRAEARLQLGDIVGARADLEAAGTPVALRILELLSGVRQ